MEGAENPLGFPADGGDLIEAIVDRAIRFTAVE